MDWFELEEEGLGVADRFLGRLFPRHVHVGAEDYSSRLAVPRRAVREALWWETVSEGALAAGGWVVGKASAGDEEDGGGAPVE